MPISLNSSRSTAPGAIDTSTLQPIKDQIDKIVADDTLDDAAIAKLKGTVEAIKIPDISTKADKTELSEAQRVLEETIDNETNARVSADTALGTRITTVESRIVESRIVDPDTTAWTSSGGNTELKIVIPDRWGAQPDTLNFRLYDRRTASNPNRFKDISISFSVFNHAGGSGWTVWLDTAYPVAIWQDVTFPDGAVMRIHLHYFVTPQGSISLDFVDSHANANNTYGAVGNIRVTYARKVVANVVSVPMGTTVRRICTVTANDGALTVNGLGSDILYTGTSARIKVNVPAGQEIVSVTAPSGMIVAIADPVTGALEVAIADTFTAATANLSVTFQQVQVRSTYAVANAGTWVSFKTLQWCIPTGGNRSLQMRSVSGSVNLRWINLLAWDGTATPTSATVTTSSTQYLKSDWNFGSAGNNQRAIVEDLTNNKRYKVLMMINGSYNNNVFVVEDIT